MVALATAALLLGQRLGVVDVGLERLERWSVDQRFRLRGPRPPGPEVAIVVFDDRTTAEAPLLFERRSGWAQLLRALHAAGAKVIAIDAFFADPERLLDADIQADMDAFLETAPPPAESPAVALLRRVQASLDGDGELERAMEEAGEVGLILALTDRPGREGEPGFPARGRYGQSIPGERPPRETATLLHSLARFEQKARALGFATVVEDETGVVREYELVLSHQETPYAPLALQVVARYLGVNRGKVAYLGPSREVRVGERAYPLGLRNEVLLDFRGPDRTFPTYSAVDVVRGAVPAGALAGKIVWVGFSSLAHDRVRTPFGDAAGVELQATLTDGLLRGDFLARTPATTDAAVTFLLGLAVALFFMRRRALPLPVALAGTLFLLAAYLGVTGWLFVARGLWCAWVGPVLSFLLTAPSCLALAYLGEGLERRRLRHTFSRYLGDEVIRELLAHPDRLTLGGEKRNLTVLFSDIRNFSTLSESLSPERVVTLLNTYLTPMTRAVLQEGGLLDKYIGDAVMAVFGAPVVQPDHAGRALACALAMHRELVTLQPTFRQMGLQVAIGLGINTGEMVVGNMGSEERFDYTVMGDAVNLASRLEGLTKRYGVFCLVSEATRQAAGQAFTFRAIDRVQVKGKHEVVDVYELLGGPGREVAHYPGLERYDAAVEAYRRGDFEAARVGFLEFLALNPAETVATLYLERLDALGERAPDGWRGVFVHTSK